MPKRKKSNLSARSKAARLTRLIRLAESQTEREKRLELHRSRTAVLRLKKAALRSMEKSEAQERSLIADQCPNSQSVKTQDKIRPLSNRTRRSLATDEERGLRLSNSTIPETVPEPEEFPWIDKEYNAFSLSKAKKCDANVDDHSLAHPIPSQQASSSCEAHPSIRKSHWNLEEPNTDRWHRVQLQFLNHVLLVWFNRCRSGNLNIIMPDTMLIPKARETATILGTFIECPKTWIREFKDKLRKEDARQPAEYNPQRLDQSKDIADIIQEEWTRFGCKYDDSLSTTSQLEVKEETNPSIRSYEEALAIPLGERSNVVESSIESYQEALDCLMMVKSYAFSVRNLSAVVIITELEDILKLECL